MGGNVSMAFDYKRSPEIFCLDYEGESWTGKIKGLFVHYAAYEDLLNAYNELKNPQTPLADPTGYPI
jgi:hypothetical protein